MADFENTWHEGYLGEERFAIFLDAMSNDRAKAIALVDWDRRMRGALFKTLGDWELALRNSYDRVMREWWNGGKCWLLDPQSPVQRPIFHGFKDVNEQSRAHIARAMKYARRGLKDGEEVPHSSLVANLSLDFWRYLSVKAREKSLWVPVLHRAYPKGSRRDDIDRQIDQLYRVRNRIAHVEPIFRKPVQSYTTSLVHACERICPPLADAIIDRGGIARIWSERPVL